MIALRDVMLTDGLPQIIAKEPWAQALAYAVNKQIRRILTYADGVRVFSNINNAPDAILDILATELRLPHYDQSYTMQVKRELVKNGLLYWATAGTVASLEDVLTSIFGDAEIEEWFDYGGMNGHFRIVTTNPQVSGEMLDKFNRTARNAKRLSAYLEEVLVDLPIPAQHICHGAALYTHTEITLKQEG